MPDKLHVLTFHLESLCRYIKYKKVWLQICILVFPFAVFIILFFAIVYHCTWKRRENCSLCGGGEWASGFFGQVCLWLFGKQENTIPYSECTECVVSYILLQAKVRSGGSSPMLTLCSLVAFTSEKLRAVWLAFWILRFPISFRYEVPKTQERVKALSSCGTHNQRAFWRESRCMGGRWLLKGFGIPIITGSLIPPGTGKYMFPMKSCRPGEPVRAVTLSFSTCTTLWFCWRRQRSCVLPWARSRVCGLPHSIASFMVCVAEGPYRYWWTLSTSDVIPGKEPLF